MRRSQRSAVQHSLHGAARDGILGTARTDLHNIGWRSPM